MSASETASRPEALNTPPAVDTDFAHLAELLHCFVQALGQGAPATVTEQSLSQAIGDLAKLHLACQEAVGRAPQLSSDNITGTEAVCMISSLMRVQNLNTFDLALWLSRAQSPTTF